MIRFGKNDVKPPYAPEEFAAERRFPVDEKGTVQEMDVDGEYWTWDERGASWWGEYRRGDTLLRVTNYREGPSGMYFLFDFTIGGKPFTAEPLPFEAAQPAAVRLSFPSPGTTDGARWPISSLLKKAKKPRFSQ